MVHPAAKSTLPIAGMNAGNARSVEMCNDLDVSADGKRLYFTEPFAYANASSGTGTFSEAVTLARNGRILND